MENLNPSRPRGITNIQTNFQFLPYIFEILRHYFDSSQKTLGFNLFPFLTIQTCILSFSGIFLVTWIIFSIFYHTHFEFQQHYHGQTISRAIHLQETFEVCRFLAQTISREAVKSQETFVVCRIRIAEVEKLSFTRKCLVCRKAMPNHKQRSCSVKRNL